MHLLGFSGFMLFVSWENLKNLQGNLLHITMNRNIFALRPSPFRIFKSNLENYNLDLNTVYKVFMMQLT